MKKRAGVLLGLTAAAAWAEVRILEPPDGAILNRHDGERTVEGLRIAVKGTAPGSHVIVNGRRAEVRGGLFETTVTLTTRENRIVAADGGARHAVTVLWDRDSIRRYRFSVDDNIRWLKDVAEKRYGSLFENPYLAFWREMHRKFRAKIHFNIYYETEGFNLSQFPDRYRSEFQANRDWMRLTFHARANDPDRPYLHAPASQVVADYRLVTREIERFAGRELLSPVTTIHWGEATREACAALRAEGITTLAGYFELRKGAPWVSYYLNPEQVAYLSGRDYWKDTSLDLLFVRHDLVVNTAPLKEIVPRLEKLAADPRQSEVLELMIHEQQYHPDFRGYAPDYTQRVERALEWVTRRGYRPVFYMEGFLGAPERDDFVAPVPKSAAEWARRKTALRATLRRLLGEWPPLFTPKPELTGRETRAGYTLERIRFDNGAGAAVPGYVLMPEGRTAAGPAILYHHYHGGKYENGKEETLTRAFSALDFATGEALARAGYLVLAIDSYAFGERRMSGPGGPAEEGRAAEWSLFKDFLWRGRTLWGMMVRDDLLALEYLLSRKDVDPERVAAMGMSMGSTRTWWAAAMDERIKVAVSVACLTRYQDLAANGAHAQHGFYYFVPGMLKEKIDTESVVGLIAPRAHLTLTGAADAGSPFEGVQLINDFQRRLYALLGRPEAFRGVLYPGAGHVYTPEMWRETMEWLKERL